MNVNVTLRLGPLDIEVEADDDEEYQKEILDIVKFFEENEEKMELLIGLNHSPRADHGETSGENEQTPLGNFTEEADQTSKPTSEVDAEADSVFNSIHRRTGVDKSTLARLFDIPNKEAEDDNNIPAIFIDEFENGKEVFGSSRTERQARASLVLLYLWEECLNNEEIKSSDLSDALHMSGIDPTNKSNMYYSLGGDADRYFSRQEGGHTLGLSSHGTRAAVDEIQRIVSELT